MATHPSMELPMLRRRWKPEEKQRLVAECSQPGANLSLIARANGLHPNLLFKWKRKAKDSAINPAEPDSRLREAEERIRKLEEQLASRSLSTLHVIEPQDVRTKLSATGRVRAEGRIITLLNRKPAHRAKLLAYMGFKIMPDELDEILLAMVQKGLIECIETGHRTLVYALAVELRVRC